MKTLSTVAACLALAAAAALPAAAQPAGMGPGMGPGMGQGHGPRMGHWGSRYTPGWGMMTPEEREAHRDAMRTARTYGECRKALDSHRALMQERAKERGVTLPAPRRDACAGLPRR